MGEVARPLMDEQGHEDDQEAQVSLITETGNGPTVENEDVLIEQMFHGGN